MSYACDLRPWFTWCHQNHLPPFAVPCGRLELWARDMEAHGRAASTVARRLSTVAIIDDIPFGQSGLCGNDQR
ncbi:MAG: hypothetical protein M3083_06130 [Actinomycetota bacterium]|nr:hypothetical protein [Actinomycetota bacterium]